MSQLAYTRGFVDRAASSDELIRFVGATEGEKPDGISLKMSGADLTRYRANPVFLHEHRARAFLPIGRSERTEVEGSRLLFDIRFDRADAFAAEVERKYRDGFLNAVSIGFSVAEWEDPKSNYYTGGVATRWELFELSEVTLPADKDALKLNTWGLDDGLLESLRGLLDRLDARAVAELRQLLDGVGRTDPGPDDTPPPVGGGRSLDRARQLARLAGI